MSRTVHHITYKNRLSTKAKDAAEEANGWRVLRRRFMWNDEYHTIRTLRYSAKAVAEARGRRPVPVEVVSRLESHEYPRSHGIGHRISYRANRQERALRAADRVAARRAVQHLRATGIPSWYADRVDVEFPDPRHQHFAVWDSW